MQGRRILVTGGAGFIGSELVAQLAAGGADVTVVDNLVNGKRANLAGLDPARVRLEVADIRDQTAMKDLIGDAEIVFHLACLGVRHSIHSPLENQEVNGTATLRLLELAHHARVARFVYVSSSEVYGTAQSVPIGVDHPTYPHTVYGASKLAGESYARAYHDTYGMNTVVVRPFNAYGPRSHHEGDSGEVIPKFILRALADMPMVIFGDGSQTRDFTFVSDTARAIILTGEHQSVVGKTINVGSGREIRIDELAKLVAEVIGKPDAAIVHDAPRPGDVLRLLADSGEAQSLLGFSPQVSLREGLAQLLDWYGNQDLDPAAMLASEEQRNWERAAP